MGLAAGMAGLGAPVFALPLQQVVVGRLLADIAAARLFVGLDRHLRLAGRPPAGRAALVAVGDLGLDPLPQRGVGLFGRGGHGARS